MTATRSLHRIQYGTDGRVLVRPRRGLIEIAHRLPDPTDDCRYIPVLNAEQRAAVEALGARNRIDYYVLPITDADAVLAIAADAWGQPTDTDGYEMPTTEEPATKDEPQTQATEEPATVAEAAARLITEHASTLYAALHSHIAAQARSGLNPALVTEDNEQLAALADRILNLAEALPAPERWTIESVAEFLRTPSAGSARKTLSRWGVKPVGREPGRGGQSLYDPAQVRAARDARPGRGARTDLT